MNIRKLTLAVAIYLMPLGASAQTPAQQADLMVLDNMKQQGADLSKPTHVLFYFYFPKANKTGPAKVETYLKAKGYTTTLRAPDDTPEWVVIAETQMVPEKGVIFALTTEFNALAEKQGGEYDGWEAAITK